MAAFCLYRDSDVERPYSKFQPSLGEHKAVDPPNDSKLDRPSLRYPIRLPGRTFNEQVILSYVPCAKFEILCVGADQLGTIYGPAAESRRSIDS